MATADVALNGRPVRLDGSASDDYFTNMVKTGRADEPVIDGMTALIPPDGVCLDIGANIGVYSVGIAPAVPRGRIIACEPAPETYGYLVKNVTGLPVDVVTLQVACSDKPGTAMLNFTGYFAAGSHLNAPGEDPDVNGAELVEVPVTTVDLIVDEYELDRVDAIKIDVEGYEMDVLAGAAETLRRFEPIVQFEFNHVAFTQHVRLLPQDVLDGVLDIFPFLYVQSRRDARLARIADGADRYRMLWANGVLGPVDNLVGAFRDVAPDAPRFDTVWPEFTRPFEVPAAPSQASAVDPEVRRLHAEVDAIHGTLSWRVTRPLRAIRTAYANAARSRR